MPTTVFIIRSARDDEGRTRHTQVWWGGYPAPVRAQEFHADDREYARAQREAGATVVVLTCHDPRCDEAVYRRAKGIVAREHVAELQAMVRCDREGLAPWERTRAVLAREALACVPALA